MKKRKIAVISCIMVLLFLLVGIVFGNSAKAEENKEYDIENAEFVVDLMENGNAEVTETWTVNFKKGKFTRFYVERFRGWEAENPVAGGDVEKYDKIKYKHFWIDGKECKRTKKIDERPENRYYIDDEGLNMDSYGWFFKAENRRVELKVQYVLTNLVKIGESSTEAEDFTCFSYRFIGRKFEHPIEHVAIEINPPDYCQMKLYSNLNESVHNTGGKAELESEYLGEGGLQLYIEMPEELFSEKLEKVGVVDISLAMESMHTGQKMEAKEEMEKKTGLSLFEKCLLYVLCPLGAIVWILLIYWGIESLVKRIITKRKVKNILQDPERMQKILNKFQTTPVTPIEFHIILEKNFGKMNIFRLIFLELLRKNIVSISEKSIRMHLGEKNGRVKIFEKKFLEMFQRVFLYNEAKKLENDMKKDTLYISHMKTEELDGCYDISFDNFMEILLQYQAVIERFCDELIREIKLCLHDEEYDGIYYEAMAGRTIVYGITIRIMQIN